MSVRPVSTPMLATRQGLILPPLTRAARARGNSPCHADTLKWPLPWRQRAADCLSISRRAQALRAVGLLRITA
ncbi:MAG: hypothetical protein SGPRY_013735, partial [Prymnesium sp.]